MSSKAYLNVGFVFFALIVFASRCLADVVGNPFQLNGPKVAANSVDKWVLAMDNRILVITKDGRVFAHDIDIGSRTVGQPFPLPGPPVAAQPIDRWVLAMGQQKS